MVSPNPAATFFSRGDDAPSRLIAFYLPQFHPIPENDTWWGKGFTEWTNVTKARPQFEGHYQPRLPADLGFYDLRLPETRQAQADLARAYGIYGFCYHYYWFKDGRQLLERPLQEVMASGKPDFPFCLCWANENWSRRWDGQERDILMPQDHSLENSRAFIRSVIPFFKDPRYIRVNGRPLLVIYRALLPDLPATIAMWREEVARHGLPHPYLVATESFDVEGEMAVRAGFDAICEFPPHKSPKSAAVPANLPGLCKDFVGGINDYDKVARSFIERSIAGYPVHRCVTLAWDNTARRGNAAHIMVNFSLQTYHHWLREMVAFTRRTFQGEERFLFVNAWNEWAEGTYLEPDQLYGHAYLEATRAALLDQDFSYQRNAAKESVLASDVVAEAHPAQVEIDSASKSIVPSTSVPGTMKLVAIAMVGNEADIIEAFVRENIRFVDHMLIADHNSLDGTQDILAQLVLEGLPITVEKIETVGYAQGAVTNALLNTALDRFNPDWIIPLDADEFLDAVDRKALESDLSALRCCHGRLPWVHHVPTSMDDEMELHPAKRIRHRYIYPSPDPGLNPYAWKLVLNAALISPYRDRYELEKGSHRIVFKGSREPSAQPVHMLASVRLRHYPIRSFEQMSLKAGIGLLQGNLAGKAELGGSHIPKLWQMLIDGKHDMGHLQHAVRGYLDFGRNTPEETADTPVMPDPLERCEPLRHHGYRQPMTTVFLRWISQQHDPANNGGIVHLPAKGRAKPLYPNRKAPASEPVWKTQLTEGDIHFDAHYHDNPRHELLEFVKGPVTALLDVGCAGGATAMLLKRRFPQCHTVGIELNPKAAALAATRMDRVICANVEQLTLPSDDLPPNHFDLILLADVLEHLYNPWQSLLKLRTLLKPGGQVIACLPNVFNLQVLEQLAEGSWKYEKDGILDITHIRFFAREDMRRLFSETGYEVEAMHALATPENELPGFQRDSLYSLSTQYLGLRNLPPQRLEDLLQKQFVIVARSTDCADLSPHFQV